MISRRKFIKNSATATMGAWWMMSNVNALATPFPGPGKKGNRLSRIGIQLYSIRDWMAEGVENTLEKVATVGYKEVEFAGYFDHEPATIKKMLDDNGLTAPAAHVGLDALKDNLGWLLEACETLGHEYLVCPWLPDSARSLDGYKTTAEFFNRIGADCKKGGVQFAYHNHDFEFQIFDGKVGYDILLDETDADLVAMELDFFWIAKAGYDALEYFDRYPGRFPLSHVKDMGEDQKMVDVGEGNIDFTPLFAQQNLAGMKHFFVEHDNPEDPARFLKSSYKHVAGLEF